MRPTSHQPPNEKKAATIAPDSDLRAEIDAIAKASTDPKVRAFAALRLVEEKTRYFFIGIGDGGYVPAAADETWRRKFGDCKGKTALLLAVLKELNVPAEPALVSLGGLALLTWFNPLRALPQLPAVSAGSLVVSGTKITMEAPKLTGFTRDNRAYNLTAEAAAQDFTNPAAYTNAANTWANSTIAGRLVAPNPNPTGAAGDLDGNATRRAQALAAGYPANFFVVNPDVNQVNVTDSGAFSKYNALQLELRRRLSSGFSANVNYQYAFASRPRSSAANCCDRSRVSI